MRKKKDEKLKEGDFFVKVMEHSGLSLQRFLWIFSFLIVWHPSTVMAEKVRVAVAANFLTTFKTISKHFEQETGHEVLISPGSSGKLYVQIQNGAPFDVFLSADARRPQLLEVEGVTVLGSRFTYAVGRLSLWSADALLDKGEGKIVLSQGNYEYLAIANPKTAPYGQAAVQTLKALKVWEQVRDRLVQGENIGQTLQFVITHNAQLGFVALSQVLDPKLKNVGTRWDVPSTLHDPLTQQAVLLTRGQRNSAARTLMDFMKGKVARDIIEKFGYEAE